MTTDRPPLVFLSEAALDEIEHSAYRLLDEVGVSLQHRDAVDMLHGLGCRIERGRTLIPRDVVHWALSNVTPDRELRNPDGSHAFTLGDGRVRFHASRPAWHGQAVRGRTGSRLSLRGDDPAGLGTIPSVAPVAPGPTASRYALDGVLVRFAEVA